MVIEPTFEALRLRFESAKSKAEKSNPYVETIEKGRYKIIGNNSYTVVCGRNEQGYFFVACTCKGALHGNPCYHGYKAMIHHIALCKVENKEKEKSDRENIPYLKNGTGKLPDKKLGNIRI